VRITVGLDDFIRQLRLALLRLSTSRSPDVPRISLATPQLKKYVSINAGWTADSRNRCETTIGQRNELFWTEKYI
jgi:hypothetical protein